MVRCSGRLRAKENLSSLLRSSESISFIAQRQNWAFEEGKRLKSFFAGRWFELATVAGPRINTTNFFSFFEQKPNFVRSRRRLVGDQFCLVRLLNKESILEGGCNVY